MAETRPLVEVTWTQPADSLAWIAPDLAFRLVPFAVLVGVVQGLWRPAWLGLAAGQLGLQLTFGLGLGCLMFAAATLLQLRLSRRRGTLRVPAGAADAGLQAVYYALNGPLEEAFFRGIVQGGLGALLAPPLGFLAGTSAYVLYHRLGRWSWTDTLATTLVGVPLGLAFWLLPGPASLLGVSIAHVGATCGYVGLGPYLLARLGWLQDTR